jgi:guanidinobutyrase
MTTTTADRDAEILEELRLLLRPAGGGLYLVSTGAAEQKALQRRFYAGETDEDVTGAFEASLARLKDARVVILGVPSDTGAGFHRGSNLGPQGIRDALLARTPALRERFDEAGIVDAGDVVVVPQLLDDEMVSFPMRQRALAALYADVPDVRRAELPVAPLSIAERAWRLILELNPAAMPVTYGGDHSTAWPAVKALHDAGRRFCILQFDAHTDLLEARLGVRMCFATWSFHANNLIGRKQRLIQVGLRASRHPREHWERTLGVRQFWAKDVNADVDRAVDDVVAAVRATGLPCFLSNDIDGTDDAFASATGTPEPGGLHPAVVERIIDRVGREVGFVGADLMEVAPMLERRFDASGRGTTMPTAVRYVEASLAALLRPRGPGGSTPVDDAGTGAGAGAGAGAGTDARSG